MNYEFRARKSFTYVRFFHKKIALLRASLNRQAIEFVANSSQGAPLPISENKSSVDLNYLFHQREMPARSF